MRLHMCSSIILFILVFLPPMLPTLHPLQPGTNWADHVSTPGCWPPPWVCLYQGRGCPYKQGNSLHCYYLALVPYWIINHCKTSKHAQLRNMIKFNDNLIYTNMILLFSCPYICTCFHQGGFIFLSSCDLQIELFKSRQYIYFTLHSYLRTSGDE